MAEYKVNVGDYVELTMHRKGIMRYIGKVQGKKDKTFYGIELFRGDGRNSGTIDGVEYFECVNEGKGVFVTEKEIEYILDIDNNIDPIEQLTLKLAHRERKKRQRRSMTPIKKKKDKKNKKKKSKSLMPISKSKTTQIKQSKTLALPVENQQKNKKMRSLPMEDHGKKQKTKKDKLKKAPNKNDKDQKKKTMRPVKKLEIGKIEKNANETKPVKHVLSPKITQKEKKNDKQKEEVSGENFGYSEVHNAFIAYADENGFECSNPGHLVLYAKKKGISGVGYAKVVQYFKARKQG